MEIKHRILSDFTKVNVYKGVGNDYSLYLLSENTQEDICLLIFILKIIGSLYELISII